MYPISQIIEKGRTSHRLNLSAKKASGRLISLGVDGIRLGKAAKEASGLLAFGRCHGALERLSGRNQHRFVAFVQVCHALGDNGLRLTGIDILDTGNWWWPEEFVVIERCLLISVLGAQHLVVLLLALCDVVAIDHLHIYFNEMFSNLYYNSSCLQTR